MIEEKVEAVIITREERERQTTNDAFGALFWIVPQCIVGILYVLKIIGPYS